MKKTNTQITNALTAASGDIMKAAAALNVSVRWLKFEKAARKL